MASADTLAQAFKYKAFELRDIVSPYLSAELRVGMSMLEVMDDGKLTAAFNEHVVVPYVDRIKAMDAAFFLSDTLGTEPILMALRASWGDLPADKQGEVWKLLAMLCGVSKRYMDAVA